MPQEQAERSIEREREWPRTIARAVLVIVAGATWIGVQTSIANTRARLPVVQYLECVQKVSNYDWSRVSGEKPSASEVCENLAQG